MESIEENEGKETIETQEEVVETQDNQDGDFDSSSFLDEENSFLGGEQEKPEDGEVVENTQEEEESSEEEIDSPWDVNFEDNSGSESETVEEVEEEEEVIDSDKGIVTEGEPHQVLTKFKDIGLEAESVEDLVSKVEGVLQEREIFEKSKYTNKNVDSWKKALNLDDKELVFRNFMAEKASKEEAEAMTNSMESNDSLKTKAHEIRVALRNSIEREQNSIKQAESEKVAMQQEKADRARRELKEHITSTETMFGFNMTNKADQLPKVQEQHLDYIQSGKFWSDATQTPAILSEVAWFVKHREQITKAFKNKGVQTGKQEILNDINNATRDDAFRVTQSEDGSEFNPNAFMDE